MQGSVVQNAAATAYRSQTVDCGRGALHVRIWPGDPAQTVVIWHGITGTGLDHLELADRLSGEGYQVVAPDSPGCGASDWATDPDTDYGFAVLKDMAVALLDALGIDRAVWLGLSKGGSLGIRLAAAMPHRIRALLLCDVGPGLPAAFRGALAKRLSEPPVFAGVTEFRDHIARMLTRAGVDQRDALIDRLTTIWRRRMPDGTVGYHYDPALSRQFLTCPEDFDLWADWDTLSCPAHILKCEHSDVLPEQDLRAMLRRNDRASMTVLAGSGHLNFLDTPEHQDVVIAILASLAGRDAV